jgi:subtilisin-like proprotein convertase family protein
MPATNWRWSALAALVIAAACTDVVPTAPNINAARPLFDVSDAATPPTGRSFCNPAVITIPASTTGAGPADVFPSLVEVSGIASTDFKVTVTVQGLTHTFASDIDMLLVGPTGATVMLMSDAGGTTDFRNTTVTFDDDATSLVPTPAQFPFVIPSGTYKPTYNGTGDAIPGGTPPEPYGSSLSTFADGNPNGTWRLYVWDDLTLDVGVIAEGWCVTISSANEAPVANAGGPYTADEGSVITFNGAGSSDDKSIVSYAWTFGDGSTGDGPNPQHAYADNRTYEVTLVVTDDDGVSSEAATTTAIVGNVAPVVTALTLPPAPVAIGTPITLAASFTDVGTGDTHTATFDLDQGGSTAAGVVVESNGSGSATASVTFTEAGVYTIRASVTDDDNDTGSRSSALDVAAYVVVYDPSGGFVTGGGWISSPAGALASDPEAFGTASFGFVAKYHTGARTPSGNTEFQFHAGNLNFASTSYDWLVVASSKAKYKGQGTINGEGLYGFMLTAIDGGSEDGRGDAFRIKIWDLASGVVVYDNRQGERDESDASTALGGGSIVIHKSE